jgi:hypothetical protein
MEFVYDPDKSAANKAKHGIDFDEAQALWDDENLIRVPTNTHDEARYMLIAKMSGKHWAAIYTQRAEQVRLISVRRARRAEIARYEST